MAVGGDGGDEACDDTEAEFLVSHLSASEAEGRFDLHIFAEEVDGMIQFHAEIVGVNIGAELELFDLVGVLMLFGFLLLFGLFVSVFAEVDDTADRRSGIGGHFHKIDPFRTGQGDGLTQG